MTTDNNTVSTIHTNREYVDHVRSNPASNSTTLLHHSLSSHSFEQDISKNALPNNLNQATIHDRSLLPFEDEDDEDENIAHNNCHRRTVDPTILIDSDQVLTETHKVDIHNLSDYSLAPVRLMTTFDDNFSKSKQMDHHNVQNLKHPQIEGSPNDVKGFDSHTATTNITIANQPPKISNNPLEKTKDTPSEHKLDLPKFHLTTKLSLSLPQPTIDRISFYGVVYSVNHEIHGMAREDHRPTLEDTTPSNEDDSPLVYAVLDSNPTPPTPPTLPSHQNQIAILDEEEFLLAVIRSRTPEEKAVRACPTSFAEAIGEVESGETREGGQTPNPLSVLAPSRTQLWKPSRSWWEAKSGKNPWIEPRSHNKRWRYLWPLIHYHKFLAKCIKKLKRNSIDVKTCISPVSTFLRSEVCAVSNHLAASSRFTSDQWMEGLPDFHGWIPKDPTIESKIRNLVVGLPLRSLGDPVVGKSSLLRSRIDECFLAAMEADRGQMVVEGFGEGSGREERFESGGEVQYPVVGYGNERMGTIRANGATMAVNRGQVGYARPPKSKPPKKVPGSGTKQRRPKKKVVDTNGINGGYTNNAMGTWNRQGHHMMPPHSHLQHGMYPPHYNNHYAGQPPPHNTYPTGNGYSFGNGVGAPPNMYGGTEDYAHHHPQTEWGSHPMNANMHYYNRWEQPPMTSDVQYFQQPSNGSVASWTTHEDMSISQTHYPEQLPPTYNPNSLQTATSETHNAPKEASATTVNANPPVTEFPRRDTLQTPSKTRHNTNEKNNPNPGLQPDSPYWAHLGFSTLAMSGLATPQGSVQRAASPLTRVPGVEGGAGGEGQGEQILGGVITVQASKPLLLNAPYSYHHQCNAMNVPPSPATQFLMSPQTNSRTTAFFAHTQTQTQMNPAFPPASPHHHHQPQQHPSESQPQMAIQQQTFIPDSPELVERTEKRGKDGEAEKISGETEEVGEE